MHPGSADLEKDQARHAHAPNTMTQSATIDRAPEQVHEPDNYHEQWAPRFRQIQSQGPSKKEEQYDRERDLTWVSKLRRNIREPAAEFLGVFIMICFGDGSVAQVNLSKNAYGEYQSISWCWGIGVMFGVYIACVFATNPYVKLLTLTLVAGSLAVTSTLQ